MNVQRLLRYHLFQPPVFVFQLAELLHITDFKPGIVRPPLIEGGIRGAVFATKLLDPRARLSVIEQCNDLFIRVGPSHENGTL